MTAGISCTRCDGSPSAHGIPVFARTLVHRQFDLYTKRELKPNDKVEIELSLEEQLPADKALLHNTALDSKNQILKGTLREINQVPSKEKFKTDGTPRTTITPEYIVEIDGKRQSFHPTKENSRPYTALTLDFELVPIRAIDDRTLENRAQTPGAVLLGADGVLSVFARATGVCRKVWP